jgi:hypothetical protein
MPTAQQWAAAIGLIGSLSVTAVALVNVIDVWYWTPKKEGVR